VVLYVVGVRRLHLHDFNSFILVVIAVAAAIVGVFFATRSDGGPSERRSHE
jgi:hypothetical protein